MTFFSHRTVYNQNKGGDGVKQIIYIDVLIFLNTAITFLLLLASSKLMKLTPSAGRFVIGSIIGGASSLIIFAPEMGFIPSLLTKMLFSLIITLSTYNPGSIKMLLRQTGYFFAVSFIFAGIILFVSSIPGISLLTYNNGAIYIDLSIFSLIAASVLCYVITIILNKITRHKQEGDILCNIKILKNKTTVSGSAIIDTGNSLCDPFTGESIIISDKFMLDVIIPEDIQFYIDGNNEMCTAIRLVPCSTVTADALLPVFRADMIVINDSNNKLYVKQPLIAVSNNKLTHTILPSDIFKNAERSDKNEKVCL